MEEMLQLPGEWALDDSGKRYPGVLFVDTKGFSVCLKVWSYGESQDQAEIMPSDFVRSYICGTLLDGKKMTLASCVGQLVLMQCSPRNPQCLVEYKIVAKYAFVNVLVESEHDLMFDNVRIDFGDIGEWAMVAETTYEMAKPPDINHSVWHCKSGLGTQIWLRNDVDVCFWAAIGGGAPSNKHAEVVIRQPVSVTMRYVGEMPWGRIMDDIEIVTDLISFCMNRCVRPRAIKVVHKSMFPGLVGKYFFPPDSYFEDVYIGTKRTLKPIKLNSLMMALVLPEIVPLFKHGSLDGHRRLVLVRPVIKLFLEAHVYTEEVEVEKVFINLVQGLEAAHRALDLANGGKGKQVCLRRRLEDMLVPVCESDFEIFTKDEIKDRINEIKATRNYYTHYDPEDFGKALHEDKLLEMNQKLVVVLRYYILKILGVDDGLARKRMRYDPVEQVGLMKRKVDFSMKAFGGGNIDG